MGAVINVKALSKWYGKVPGIQEVDLEVKEGEIFGFLGPNGAGKTTTIRILMGFVRPTSGVATVLGLDCWTEATAVKARTGYLPDSPALYGNLTGEALLDLLARLQGGRPPVLRRQALDRLELGRADLARPVKGYSRGMRQKLALVQALQHDPELLILDEPTEGLDPLMQQALSELLRGFHERGRTVFMSSHNLPEVERLCTRVGIVREGRMVAVEAVEELRGRAVRRIEVVLAQDVAEERLRVDGVVSLERQGPRLRLMVGGDINPVLRELAVLGVKDLVVEQPHLEDIFLSYYRSQARAG